MSNSYDAITESSVPSKQNAEEKISGSALELEEQRRRLEEEAKLKQSVLAKVKDGDLSGLELQSTAPKNTPDQESGKKIQAAFEAMNPGTDKAGGKRTGIAEIKEGMTVEQSVAAEKAEMRDLFGDRDIKVFAIKGTDGKDLVAIVGVSAAEANAAIKLKRESIEAEDKAHRIEITAKGRATDTVNVEDPSAALEAAKRLEQKMSRGDKGASDKADANAVVPPPPTPQQQRGAKEVAGRGA